MDGQKDQVQILNWSINAKISREGFDDLTLGIKNIEKVNIGHDTNGGVPAVKITYKLDVSETEIFSKPHTCQLEICNKDFSVDEVQEIYTIELLSLIQSTRQVPKDENKENYDAKTVIFSVRYFCKDAIDINTVKVHGSYDNMTLTDIIKDLYKQTGCKLQMNLDELDNKKKYDNILIPLDTFGSTIRYLNTTYGLYNSELIMFADTFIQKEKRQFVITSIDKIKSEVINLHAIPDTENNKLEIKKVTSKNYYIREPINISNSIVSIVQKLPKKYKAVAFPSDKFFEEKEIDVKKIIKTLKFVKNVDQFQDDKNFNFDEERLYVDNIENFEMTIPSKIQKIISSAIKCGVVSLLNPFLISHFRLGNVINYETHTQDYLKSDIKFFIFGTLLIFEQRNNNWKGNIKLRLGAASLVN